MNMNNDMNMSVNENISKGIKMVRGLNPIINKNIFGSNPITANENNNIVMGSNQSRDDVNFDETKLYAKTQLCYNYYVYGNCLSIG